MLYAIGIYQCNHKFEKMACAPKAKGLFSGHPLAELEKDTLPNLGVMDDNRIYHYQMSNEHQYIKKIPQENVVIAITGKTKWSDRELHFLFLNINYIRIKRSSVKATLEDVLKNPLDFTGKDRLLGAVQESLDDTTALMHANLEKVIQRGEDIDKTLEKSIELEQVSETFNKKAKKLNSCCG